MNRRRNTRSPRQQCQNNVPVFSSWLPRDQVKLLDRFPTRIDQHSDAFSTISLMGGTTEKWTYCGIADPKSIQEQVKRKEIMKNQKNNDVRPWTHNSYAS